MTSQLLSDAESSLRMLRSANPWLYVGIVSIAGLSYVGGNLVAGGIALAVGSGLVGALYRFRRLMRVTEALARSDFSVPGRIDGHGERDPLARGIYSMADRLLTRVQQAENERNLMRTIIDNIPDLIYAKDDQGHFLIANQGIAKSMGVAAPDDLLGKSDFDFHPAELAEGFYADEQEMLRSGRALVNHVERIIDPDSGDRWLLSTKVPVYGEHGERIGLVGINRDITDIREAEAKIAEERNILRTFVDNLPDLAYIKDKEARFLLANAAVADLMNAESPEMLIGKWDFDFYPHELASQYYADDQRVTQAGESILEREEPLDHQRTGKKGWLLTSKIPLRDQDGQIIGLLGIGRDVTRLKTVSEQARKAVTEIGAAAMEIRAVSNQQVASATQQDTAITETMATVHALREAINQTADRAQRVADIARLSVQVSGKGQEAVSDTISGMNHIQERADLIAENTQTLSERTKQIGEIIDTVNALADRSKLLALNASIEAARAGEEGRGFGVVAQEVRQLADQSHEATARAQAILTEIQQAMSMTIMATQEGSKEVAGGVTLVEKAGHSISDLTERIAQAQESVIQIAANIRQQADGIDQLASTMMQIREASMQVTGSVRQTEENLTMLLELAQQTERVIEG